jgi:hypothetical protein
MGSFLSSVSMLCDADLRALARDLRARAEEILTRAETFHDAYARLKMRGIASSYEKLAHHLEQKAGRADDV